jgi:hypothetical protein
MTGRNGERLGMKFKLACLAGLSGLFVGGLTLNACDLCGCYTPQIETMPQMAGPSLFPAAAGWYAALAEQFTYFGTLQRDGHEVSNPTGQYESSSITQVVAGFAINSRFALQVNVPLIYREFKRPEGFAIDRGTESGLGDISLLLKTVVIHYESPAARSFEMNGKNPVAVEHQPDFAISVLLLTGLKLPTGGTSRLTEEFHEVDVPGAPPSGIHGHDLTLGTGSYDGIFGEETSLRYKRAFFETNVQFTLRGDGAHQYHFANDLGWSGGPGYYFVRNSHAVVGLQFVASGEYKDVDRFRGARAGDTGITPVFLGPRVVASYARWSGDIAVELPVVLDNTALQAVPDYRLRAGVSFHF